jgi:hypothetical protein
LKAALQSHMGQIICGRRSVFEIVAQPKLQKIGQCREYTVHFENNGSSSTNLPRRSVLFSHHESIRAVPALPVRPWPLPQPASRLCRGRGRRLVSCCCRATNSFSLRHGRTASSPAPKIPSVFCRARRCAPVLPQPCDFETAPRVLDALHCADGVLRVHFRCVGAGVTDEQVSACARRP